MEYWAAVQLAIEYSRDYGRAMYVVPSGTGGYWPMVENVFNERYFRHHRPLLRVGAK